MLACYQRHTRLYAILYPLGWGTIALANILIRLLFIMCTFTYTSQSSTGRIQLRNLNVCIRWCRKTLEIRYFNALYHSTGTYFSKEKNQHKKKSTNRGAYPN